MDDSLSVLFGGACTADALLVVREEARRFSSGDGKENAAPASKRQRTDDALEDRPGKLDGAPCASMLGHKAVLWPLSEFFQSKFKNWSSNSNTAEKPEILILVPAGQLDIGKALVITMYDKLPGNFSQQQLLQLLALAESYKIDKFSSAVVNRLSSMHVSQLDWETVLAVYQLPAADDLYKPLRAAARRRLLQVLGDFELIWALEQPHHAQQLLPQLNQKYSEVAATGSQLAAQQRKKAGSATAADLALLTTAEKVDDAIKAAKLHAQQALHARLLQLPFELLLELVSASGTRVASEDTVFYTIERWLLHNSAAVTEQRQQLAEQLRLRQCTPSYLLNEVCSEDKWLDGLLPANILVTETALCLQPGGLCGLSSYDHRRMGGQRSKSVVEKLELSWKVPVSDLAAAYNRGIEQVHDFPKVDQPQLYQWQGRAFQLRVCINQHADMYQHQTDTDGWVDSVSVGVLMSSEAVEEVGQGGYYSSKVTAWKSVLAGAQPEVALQHIYDRRQAPKDYIGEDLYLVIDSAMPDVRYFARAQQPAAGGVMTSWQDVEHALADLGLVHDDGCLHVSAEIWDLQ